MRAFELPLAALAGTHCRGAALVQAAPPQHHMPPDRRPADAADDHKRLRAMLEEAKREVKALTGRGRAKLHGRDDVTFVDIRDPREREREGKMPGAFSVYARHAGILDRSGKPLPQADFRRGQEVRVLLRRRLALVAGGANRAADGAEARRAHERRVRRVEEVRRASRDAGAERQEVVP